MVYKIALVGNPNVGKTSLYNKITNSLEHVGNWHGVTVEDKHKKIFFENDEIIITDLPGCYSLTSYSYEETVSRDNVLSKKNDAIICVCDVNNLSQNLYLVMQMIEANLPVIVAVNMIDDLQKIGKIVDIKKLENHLKIPVIVVSAKTSYNLNLLIKTAIDVAKKNAEKFALKIYSTTSISVARKKEYDDKNADFVNKYLYNLPIIQLSKIILPYSQKAELNHIYTAIKLLEKDKYIFDKLQLDDYSKNLVSNYGDFQVEIAKLRYEYIDLITKDIIVDLEFERQTTKNSKSKHHTFANNNSEKSSKRQIGLLDKIVLNKYLGLPLFLLIMCIIFLLTFGVVGSTFTKLLDICINKFLYIPINKFLTKQGVTLWLTNLICDGIIKGIGSIFSFLPQIILLFLCLSILEESGYISRVAFVTDGMFRKIGLTGRAVFTMLMGLGCSATAVLTARGLEDNLMRKKTVILTPFISCSARLPVYITIFSAFFVKHKPLMIFILYVLSAVVVIFWAAIFEKFSCLKSNKPSFIMEMPRYRIPSKKRVLQLLFINAKSFFTKIVSVIFCLNIIVWILSNFSFTSGFVFDGSDKTMLQVIGSFLSPLFSPLGFGNWKAVTALIGGLVAKETVGTTIQSLGGIEAIFVGKYANVSALSFAVFTLLYTPCIATLSVMKKEVGTKWMCVGICLQLFTAYMVALLVRIVGILLCKYPTQAISVCVFIAIAILIEISLYFTINKRSSCCISCNLCDKNY